MPSTRASSHIWKAVLVGLTHPVVVSAQRATNQRDGQAVRAEVEVAAVRYVKAALDRRDARIGPVGSLLLDQRFGSDSQPYAKGAQLRSAQHARLLAAALGSRMGDGDTVLECGDTPRTCRMLGDDVALVRVTPAVVRGNSAFTSVSLLRATGSTRAPVSRMTWNLVLRAEGGAWRVLPKPREIERT